MNEIIIPGRLFQEPIEIKINKRPNPKSIKQLARDCIKLAGTQLNKELAKKMINPYYTDRSLKVGFYINLDTHHFNHAISKLTITTIYPEFGIKIRYINETITEISVIYARFINQYEFKYQIVLAARFDKQNEDNQVLNETELNINLNIDDNLTESDLDNIDVKSPLEHQIQQQEMKDFGWRFDKINSMTVYFSITGELNGLRYVNIPLTSSAILIIGNNDKYCFLWSILAFLHPCNNNHLNRVSNFIQ